MLSIRVRCAKCEKNFTLHTSKKKFKEGDSVGLTCAGMKQKIYKDVGDKHKGEALTFMRIQGEATQTNEDIQLERLIENEKNSSDYDNSVPD